MPPYYFSDTPCPVCGFWDYFTPSSGSLVGTYSIRFLEFDVWVAIIFGIIGYLMRKFGYPIAPMVLATVLAQMLETSLQQSLLISQGSPLIFFTRPISAVFMGLALLSFVRGIWKQMKSHAPEIAVEDES